MFARFLSRRPGVRGGSRSLSSQLSMEGMSTDGEYAANSLSQQQCFRLVVPFATAALKAAPGPRAAIADYGAADGLATRQLLEAVEAVDVGGDGLDVIVSDLPGTGWHEGALLSLQLE